MISLLSLIAGRRFPTIIHPQWGASSFHFDRLHACIAWIQVKLLSQGWNDKMTIFAAVGVLAQLCASLTTETLRILVRDTLETLNVVSFATVQFEAFSFLSLRQFHPSRCRLLLLSFSELDVVSTLRTVLDVSWGTISGRLFVRRHSSRSF